MAVTEPRHTRVGPTHEVVNQVPPLEPYNVFEQDRPLVEALHREGAAWAEAQVSAVGEIAGGEAVEWGGRRTRTRPSCARTTATATASTRWSSTPPGTS